MLWSQYKSVTIKRSQITGIPNISNQNSNFLTLQTSEFQKKIRPESSESKTESEFRLQWGSQKLEPKIRIPNQEARNPYEVALVIVVSLILLAILLNLVPEDTKLR
jgi:hypothetical protein